MKIRYTNIFIYSKFKNVDNEGPATLRRSKRVEDTDIKVSQLSPRIKELLEKDIGVVRYLKGHGDLWNGAGFRIFSLWNKNSSKIGENTRSR